MQRRAEAVLDETFGRYFTCPVAIGTATTAKVWSG